VYEDEVSSPIFSSAKVSLNRIRGGIMCNTQR